MMIYTDKTPVATALEGAEGVERPGHQSGGAAKNGVIKVASGI